MGEETKEKEKTTKKTEPQKAVRCPNCNFPEYNGKECKFCNFKS